MPEVVTGRRPGEPRPPRDLPAEVGPVPTPRGERTHRRRDHPVRVAEHTPLSGPVSEEELPSSVPLSEGSPGTRLTTESLQTPRRP